jgi:hypothetical protein
MSHMSVLGACWKKTKEKNQVIFGKEIMHEGSDNWKEEQHVCIQGIPNDVRVRVLVMHCKR